jgi:CIC family chloride channel protein
LPVVPAAHLRDEYPSLTVRIRRLLDRWQPAETGVLIATALIVGLGGGLGAVVFRWLISSFTHIFFDVMRNWLSFMGPAYVIIVPSIGGLFFGPMIYFFAREAKGHGVPEVMEAVALRGGRIRPVVVVVKALASSLCIGSGGSVGREGPIVQIGAALGSTLGQLLNLSDARIRNLVACGAAAGIAATFNSPIAGVIFALEVILGEFSVSHFSTVVISSVTASVVGRIAFGDIPAFTSLQYSLVNPWELLLYVLLGAMAGLVAVAFVWTLYRCEDLFDAWRFPDYVKPVMGGVLIGVAGFYFPQVFGVGYPAIEDALLGKMLLGTMGLLVLVKVLATSLTIGSGGSGGVFAPSLFVGAMLGGTFGTVVHQMLPGITAAPGAYALVGMAAVFAGAAHAPITAIIILFEMTNDYRIILPLMLATVISTLLSQRLNRESIYTLKLSRRGVRLEHGRDMDVMGTVRVDEVMVRQPATVPVGLPVARLAGEFIRTGRHGFAVLNEDGSLYGMVSLEDYRRVIDGGGQALADRLLVRDIATCDVVSVFPDESVGTALRRMAPRDLSRLPVVARETPRRLLGVVRRNDIVRAYEVGAVRREEARQHAERTRAVPATRARFVDVTLSPDSCMVGKTVAELGLPRAAVLVSIQRDREWVIPHGDTRVQAGDIVTALCERECIEQVKAALNCLEQTDSKGDGSQ